MPWFSKFLDTASNFLAARKGLLPILGLLLILINFILVVSGAGWLARTNFFLHLGLVTALLGVLLAWAL
jgi:hypothetical protein